MYDVYWQYDRPGYLYHCTIPACDLTSAMDFMALNQVGYGYIVRHSDGEMLLSLERVGESERGKK